MSLVNKIAYWLHGVELPEIQLPVTIKSSNRQMDYTRYNPATGSPMVGCLDVSGNIIGTNRDSDYRYYR